MTPDDPMTRAPSEHRTRWIPLLFAALVALITGLVFARALQNEFVDWDDVPTLVTNEHYRGFDREHLTWMFTTFHMGPYQPLSWFSYAIDYAIWGMDPRGYHLTNVLLHALNAALVFALGRRLMLIARGDLRDAQTGVCLAAALGALLFSIHPLRVESVAWATERRDVLSAAFFIGALLAYLRSATSASSRIWLAISFVLCVLSTLSKGIGVVAPAILVMLDIWPLRRLGAPGIGWMGASARRVWIEKLPFAALAVVGSIVAIRGQAVGAGLHSSENLSLLARIPIAVRSLAFYPFKTLVPFGLAPLYEVPFNGLPRDLAFFASAALILALTIAAWMLRHRAPAFGLAWLACVAFVAPVSGILQAGSQFAADRYSYLACIGFALAVASLALPRRDSRRSKIVLAIGALLLVALVPMTRAQVAIWHDSAILWDTELERQPNCSIALHNRAVLKIRASDFASAEVDLRRAVLLFPIYAEAEQNLALVLVAQKRFDEAEKHARIAIKLAPDVALAHRHLGDALLGLKRIEEACAAYAKSADLDPTDVQAPLRLAVLLQQVGKSDLAISVVRRTCQLMSDRALPFEFLADFLQKSGDEKGAIDAAQHGSEQSDASADTWALLGKLRAASGDAAAARTAFDRALTLEPDHAAARAGLANLH